MAHRSVDMPFFFFFFYQNPHFSSVHSRMFQSDRLREEKFDRRFVTAMIDSQYSKTGRTVRFLKLQNTKHISLDSLEAIDECHMARLNGNPDLQHSLVRRAWALLRRDKEQ